MRRSIRLATMPVRAALLAAAAILAGTSGIAVAAVAAGPRPASSMRWTSAERATMQSLSIASLPPLARDPSNRVADDERAARLGHALFFDTRLSGNGKVSCGTCHLPAQDFQDGVPLAQGMGTTTRRTMPIAGTAHGAWFFWDGRADSQWAQALGPLESAVEHGGSRVRYAHVVAERYRDQYEAVFGKLPSLAEVPRDAGPVGNGAWRAAWARMPAVRRDEVSTVYANIGKAIAAYERRIGFAASRFDRYVEAELGGRRHTAESALSPDEEAGLRLFMGKASCVNCHNGALFTDDHFHNTGVPRPITPLPADSGRATGVRQALVGEFACTSRHSDATADDCEELRFAVTEGEELVRAYKTPSLRNVAGRAPFMHAGQVATLRDVVTHYDRAPAAPAGHSELKPLGLTARERQQLEAFLGTLTGPLAAPPGYLGPPSPHR